MGKDRLDGTERGGCLFELFTLPGRIILWFQYMSPATSKGRGMVTQTRRRASSPAMAVLYSLVFWAMVALAGYGYWVDPDLHKKPTIQTEETKPHYYYE